MSRIGFIVNPYAGMGGTIGLKGTDGCVEIAQAAGSPPISPSRALLFLNSLTDKSHSFLSVSGVMGEEELIMAGYRDVKIIHTPLNQMCTAEDTKEACVAIKKQGVDLIVFCGGDGTAGDVLSIIGQDLPIFGIPAGVKMYSGVFGTTPQAAADVISNLDTAEIRSAEVMDIDEEQYRAGILSAHLKGIAKMPYLPVLCQACKLTSFVE